MLSLLAIAFAISLEASQIYTIPQPLEDTGYLYLTFCSQSSGSETLKFYANGFEVEPEKQELYFSPITSTTGVIPDCKTVAVKVSSSKPGMFELKIEGDEQDWYLPVIFWKRELSIEASRNRLYTGYEKVGFWIHGNASDVWLSINSSAVGVLEKHFPSTPAYFETELYFPKPGYYLIPVRLSYLKNGARFQDVFLLGFRVDEFPLQVRARSNLTYGEEGEVTLEITSPRPLYSVKVKLFSPCIEGESEKYFSRLENVNVSFKVKAKCEPGIYGAKVYVGAYEREIPLEIKGNDEIKVFVSPSFEKNKITLEITVANIGKRKLSSVSVELLENENYTVLDQGTFLGDLNPGDFDSADLSIKPKSSKISVKYRIEYDVDGKRKSLTMEYELKIKEAKKPWYLLALLALVIAYVYFRKTRG